MTSILHIETATSVCSVALAKDGQHVSFREINRGNAHAEKVTIFISEVMQEAGISFSELSAVAVSSGPGSYTGLRIGISTAKGICFGKDLPLISIPTLYAMAAGAKQHLRAQSISAGDRSILFCPMIDARRMEVYCALYDENLSERRGVMAQEISGETFDDYLNHHQLIFSGDGCAKFESLFSGNKNIVFLPDVLCSSRFMVELAFLKFSEKQFENLSLFEPFYLKEFVPGRGSRPI